MCIYIYIIYIVYYIFDIRYAFLLIISLCKPTNPFFCSSCILKNVSSNIPIPQHQGFSNPTSAPVRSGTSSNGGNNPNGIHEVKKKKCWISISDDFCKKLDPSFELWSRFFGPASQSNLKPQVINLSWVEQCSNPSYIPLNWLLSKDSPL